MPYILMAVFVLFATFVMFNLACYLGGHTK